MHKDTFPTDKNLAQAGANDGAIKAGPYEEYVERVAARENLLVELPADRAQSVVAYILRSHLNSPTQALVLASTKKMAKDYKELLELAGIPIGTVVTGDVPLRRRKRIWDGIDVICATPDIFLEDMKRGAVCPRQFGWVVLVDADKAVGEHNLVKASHILTSSSSCKKCINNKCQTAETAHILAITNDIPLNYCKREDILKTLRITRMLNTPWYDPARTIFPPDMNVKYVTVAPSPEIIQIKHYLTQACKRAQAETSSEAQFILQASNVLETRGIESFLNLCGGRQSKITDYAPLVEASLTEAVNTAQKALEGGSCHPKMTQLASMIKSMQGSVLVVADQNYLAQTIKTQLCNMGISAALLPEGATGHIHPEADDVTGRFCPGGYEALVVAKATDADGGLPEYGDAHTVVCYVGDCNTVQSALGCGAARVVVLVTEGSDEDPNAQPLVQQDQKTRLLIEGLRRRS